MRDIWRAAVEESQNGRDFVLATMLDVEGSSPRHVGTRFLIRRDGAIVGTIGGGLLEATVQEFASQALREGKSHRALFSFTGKDAQQSVQMICGGRVQVLVEYVQASDSVVQQIFSRLLDMTTSRQNGYLLTSVDMAVGDGRPGTVSHLLLDDHGNRTGGFAYDDDAVKIMPSARLLKPAQLLDVPGSEYPVFLEWIHPHGTVYVFGAGHVGVCVAHLASYVDFRVVVIDDRAEFASQERVPDADEVMAVESFDEFFATAELNDDSYVVIVTRGHAHDKTVLTRVLRTRAGYVGMIGSRRKTSLIYQALLMEGFSQDDLERVQSPIGLPIGGETPQEIGMSIVSEMIQMRSRKDKIQRREG
jgi:xanthine dehydrogenase accessory factor